METTPINYILAIAGMLLYIGYKIQYRKEKKKSKFNFSYWIGDNAVHVAMAVIATVAFVVMQKDIFAYVCDVLGSDLSYGYDICSFVMGFLNQTILMGIERKVKNKFFAEK